MSVYYEHNLYLNGHWRNFYVCTGSEDEPCPICEEGKTPSMVAAFTVIDHTPYTDREGKEHKDQKMLLVAKRTTQQVLEAVAVKRGGLAGVTFDIMRVDEDQSPAVGSMFDFIEKHDIEKVIKKYGAPYDYEKDLAYKTPEQLRAEGFGKPNKIGSESNDDGDDLDDLDDDI
jgi:hypothetical protein